MPNALFARRPESHAAPPPDDADVASLLELYRAHRDEVGRIVTWLLGPGLDRGPAVAAVFTEAFRALAGRPPSEPRVAWLRRLAVRTTRAHVAAARRARRTGRGLAASGPRDPGWWLLYRVLDALPARQRAVFVLHELAGLDVAEAAAALETSPRAVAARLARARRVVYATIARDPAFDPRALFPGRAA